MQQSIHQTIKTEHVQTSGLGTKQSPISLDDPDTPDNDPLPPATTQEKLPLPPPTTPPLYDKTIKDPRLLTALPLELLKMITTSPLLTPPDLHALLLTTKGLRNAELPPPPPLSKPDFILFHKTLEAGLPHPHHLLATHLLCTHCLTILPATAFPDAHAKRTCSPPRSCLRCSIRRGHFNRLCFNLRGQRHFACGACLRARPIADMADLKCGGQGEEGASGDTTELKLWQRFGAFRSVELNLKVGRERRWCRACWRGIVGFWGYAGETGRMKEVFGPVERGD